MYQIKRLRRRLIGGMPRPAAAAPKTSSYRPPSISPGSGLFFILIPFVTAFGSAVLAVFSPAGTFRWAIAAFGGAMLVLGVIATRWVINGLLARSAMLLLSPHGVDDPARAKELLNEYLSREYLPTISIRQGKLVEGSDMSLLRRGEQMDVSLQHMTGYGPAYLDVDQTSAVLLRQPGGFALYQYGLHLYGWNQRFVGAVDLKPQSLPIDDAFMTRDGMEVRIKGLISFWIIQDASTLKDNQTHRVQLHNVRRALMPNPDWRERAIRQLNLKLRDVMRSIALSDFYVTPTHLHQLNLYETVQQIFAQKPLKNTIDELRTRIISETKDRLADIGVEVRMVIIDSVTPPQYLVDEAKRMYNAWLVELDKEADLTTQSHKDMELARQKLQLAELEHKTLVIKAETDKEVEKLKAEAEAVGLETRMKARAVSAVEFARRMELVRQALGDSLDEATMRELMRALGLLVNDRRYGYGRGESRSIFEMLGRNGEEESSEE